MTPPTRRTLHLISQAHLDPVWLWPKRDGMAEVLTTFQSAVDRLREFPSFRFSRSSSAAYEWVREADPRLFNQIRELAQEGRWEIVGGWFEQPDCNLPSAESFLRQAEVARAFFEREFGPGAVTPCGYNVDSFGHCGGLPQLLRAAGLEAYAFMRPEPWSNPNVPLLFWWESPDGSRVLAVRIPGQYSQSYAATADDIERAIRHAAAKNFAPGFSHGILWFGVGNHGGGPTREHIARVLELQAGTASDPDFPEIRFSTLREFLAAVRTSGVELPVLRGELGYVFRGCYAANGIIKKQHRAAEKVLFAAEALTAAGGPPTSASAPARCLEEAWRNLLFLQFHDILAGTCVAQVQEEICERFGSVLTTARDVAEMVALRLARRVDTRGEPGSVLAVFNPLPWPRTLRVGVDTFKKIHDREEVLALQTSEGREVPLQWLPADANFGPWGLDWGKLTALVEVPASGYRVLRLRTRTVEPTHTASGELDEENPQFAAAKNRTVPPLLLHRRPALPEWLTSAGENLLAQPVRFVVASDTGGTWGHGRTAYSDQLSYPTSHGHEVLVEGPLVTILREKFTWGKSEMWLDVVHTAGSADREIRLRFNWQEHRRQLKLEIPTRLTQTVVQAQMPAEVVTRPTDGHEYSCHDWVALQGQLAETPLTLAVANDSTYSYCAQEGLLRFTLARGVPHAEHPPFDYPDTWNLTLLDQGWQERRFLLRVSEGAPHYGALWRWAIGFQTPPLAFLDSAHPGEEPWEKTGLSVEPETVAVWAVRLLEATPPSPATLLVRLAETTGQATVAEIRLQHHLRTVALAPWSMCTLRLNPANLTDCEK